METRRRMVSKRRKIRRRKSRRKRSRRRTRWLRRRKKGNIKYYMPHNQFNAIN